MDINIFLEKIEDLKIEILTGLSDKKFKSIIEDAESKFNFIDDKFVIDEKIGFNEWLIHDYKYNNQTVFEIISRREDQITKSFNNSKLSFFTVQEIENKIIFKDIFDKSDYLILNSENINCSKVYFARLYAYENGYLITDDAIAYDDEFKKIALKLINEKFKESKELFTYQTITDFIDNNKLVLYALINIVNDVNHKDEEIQLSVISVSYTHNNYNAIMKVVKADENFKHLFDNIYQYFLDETVLMEIIIEEKYIEFEFLDNQDKITGLKIIGDKFDDLITFSRETITSFDDII